MNEICLLCKESNLDNCLKCHIFSPPKEKEKKKKNIIPRTIFRKLKKKFHEKTCKCGRAFSTTNKRRINCSDCIQEKKRIKSENRYAHLGIIIHTSPTPIEQQICNICKEPKPIDEFIGINNRNLKTLTIDTGVTQKILESCKVYDKTVISESGIKTYDDLRHLRDLGVQGYLIGSSIMQSEDIENAVRGFVQA